MSLLAGRTVNSIWKGGLVNFFIRGWMFEHNISHTCVEIDHEIISTAILLPSAEPFKRVVVDYKRKYVHRTG